MTRAHLGDNIDLRFERVDEIGYISHAYLPPGLPERSYRIRSKAIGWIAGYDTIKGYIIEHKGRFIRCSLHLTEEE
jgi:hypothetical protein